MKQFISIDGKEPVNLNHLITISKMGPEERDVGFTKTYSILFIYPKTGWTILWKYNTLKERDKAYNFLTKKIAVCYSSESIIQKLKEKAKRTIYNKIQTILKSRHQQFTITENKKPLLINHENIKNQTFENISFANVNKNSYFVNKKPKRKNKLNSILKHITNYY